MPAKIRLQRQGRKFHAIYSIVVADSRAPRDGKFIESLGQYNPSTNPATIVLDFDKALEWLQKGAQPTDTCRAILSYKGVMYKKHLLEGARKGAFDEAEAEKRFTAWMTEKEQKIQANMDNIKSAKDSDDRSRFDAETKIKEERAQEIAKRRSELIAAEEAANAPAEEEVVEEVVAEAPAATEVPAETTEEPKAKEEPKSEEASAEADKEEPKSAEVDKEDKKKEE
jgi:small subunit ribosomal protein S16